MRNIIYVLGVAATMFLSLHLAVSRNGDSSSRAILARTSAYGTSPNVMNAQSVSPLLQAVGSGDERRVRALLNAGVKPDDPNDARSALVQAITSFNGATLYCNVGVVKALLDHGADPNRPDPRIGALPLHDALEVGDADCARIIKDAGARIDALDYKGHTILAAATSAAARTGNIAVVDLVIGWGVDANARDRDGATALHQAVWGNSSQIVKALLDRGLDPCVKNGIGQTPLAMARNLKRSNEVIVLLTPVTKCSPPTHDSA